MWCMRENIIRRLDILIAEGESGHLTEGDSVTEEEIRFLGIV